MRAEDPLRTWVADPGPLAGDALLLRSEGFELRYDELWGRLSTSAAELAAEGFVPGIPTAVCTGDRTRLAWSILLALATGTPVLPLDPRQRDTGRLIRLCGVRQALTDPGASLAEVPHSFGAPAPQASGGRASTGELSRLPPARIQLMMATSGSTGGPRVAMHASRSLEAAVLASRRRLGLGPGDVWLECLPLNHVGGLSVLLRCLQARATCLLHQGFEPARVWEDLNGEGVTHISLVPPMLHALLEYSGAEPPPSSLRIALVGGAALSPALARAARAARWPLCPTYGLTETASQVATWCPERDWSPGCVGKALAGLQVDIVDEEGRPVARGNPGRIRIRGPVLMLGYANPEHEPGLGLHHGAFLSNDLGRLDESGRLHVLGRTDAVLVSGGENVQPEEVEQSLEECPGVGEAAAAGLSDPVWGQVIVALYAGVVTESELERWCRLNLPSRLRPRVFRRVDALPRLDGHKLDRTLLQRMAQTCRSGWA